MNGFSPRRMTARETRRAWRITIKSGCAALTLFLAMIARADSIIPADRLFNWNAYTGVEGGIPYVSTVAGDGNANGITDSLEGIDNTGATTVISAIQSAIDAASSNQAVVLPAGTFRLTDTLETNRISFTASQNGVVLRGQGPGVTRLLTKGNAPGFATFDVNDGGHDYDFTTALPKYNVWTNLAGGDSNISTTATHAFVAGDLLWIDQRTNTHYVFLQGVPDPCFFCSGTNRYASQRIYGQISRVVSVSQNTNIVISPPIAGMFQTSNSPQVMKITAPVQKVGFEGITFTNAQSTLANYVFYWVGTANCWVTNCEFSGSYRRFIHTINTFRPTIQQNYFHDGIGSDWSDSFGPNRGYSIYLAYGTSGARVEDNIFYHLHFAVSFEGAIAYNVAAYNFHTNQIFNNRYTAQPSIGHHGGTATHNLWEGNILNSMFSLDTYWGPANDYTIFRNRVRNDASHDGETVDQYAVSVDMWKLHRYHSIVGNVFGRSADSKVYFSNGDSANQGGVRAIYRFGNPDANSTTYANFDTMVTNTLVLSNNWNAVNSGINSIEQNGATLADSYLYPSKPAYWGLTNWPTIGPDKTPSTESSMWNPAMGRFYAMNGAGVTNWYDPVLGSGARVGPGRAGISGQTIMR